MEKFKIVTKGFTLIELMIVIAIISVLAALALPSYFNFVNKAQITRVYGELAAVKISVENSVSQGKIPVPAAAHETASLEWVGWTGSNLLSSDLSVGSDTKVSKGLAITKGADYVMLTAVLGANASVDIQGTKVHVIRDKSGWWCTVDTTSVPDFKDNYMPKACLSGTAPYSY